jgi:transposase
MKKRQKLLTLTDEQWELIEPLLPKPKPRVDKRGPTASIQPALFRGHTVDSTNGRGMAISAG